MHCLATRNASFASLITTSSAIATPPRLLSPSFLSPSLLHLPDCLIFRSPSTRTTQGGATWPRGWARLVSTRLKSLGRFPLWSATNRVDFGLHSILTGEMKVPRTCRKWRSMHNVPGSTWSPQVGCAILSVFSADCGLLFIFDERSKGECVSFCSYRERSANGSIVVEFWFGYLWDFSACGSDRTADCNSAVFESDWVNSC